MARFRKLRSTLEGRQERYKDLKEALRRIPYESDEELVEWINRIHTPHLVSWDTREELILILVRCLAERIVDAP